MQQIITFYIGNNNIVEVEGVRNAITGDYQSDATVSFTLFDAETNTEITGDSWPASMTYQIGSNGDYVGTTSNTLNMTRGQSMILVVNVELSNGAVGEWTQNVIADYRRAVDNSCC